MGLRHTVPGKKWADYTRKPRAGNHQSRRPFPFPHTRNSLLRVCFRVSAFNADTNFVTLQMTTPRKKKAPRVTESLPSQHLDSTYFVAAAGAGPVPRLR